MELAEAWFELQDSLLEAPESAGERLAEFERRLAELRHQGAQALATIERQADQAAESHEGRPDRELLERLAREIQSQSYLKSMERDVERIRKRTWPT
jgi:hypothetical protein